MKKVFFLMCLLIGIGSVNAATITNAKYEDGQISLSGTGTEEVQIVLFDKDNEPLYMGTTDVVNREFNFTLPQIANLSNGTYTIKVADYDGQNVDSEEITIANSTVNNPKTGDTIINYIVLGVFSLLALAVCIKLFTKSKKNN